PDTVVPLSNRQRFLPVPYAMWTTAATNFVVSGGDNNGTTAALKVTSQGSNVLLLDGNEIDSNSTLFLNFNSHKTIETHGLLYAKKGLKVASDIESGGTINLTGAWQNSADGTTAEISSDTGGFKALMIVGNKSSDGVTRLVNIWDRLEVSGSQSVTGKLDVGGDLAVQGHLTGQYLDCQNPGCGMTEYILPGEGAWGTWTGWVNCPKNMYVCGLAQKVEPKQGDNDDTAMNSVAMRCCPF
ncbi:MAG: hypothetical protein GXP54_12455, partial [Deltaproteobacteria bacterium]|nr:hypothetical protein [Deltaproteobacteria bacterium]